MRIHADRVVLEKRGPSLTPLPTWITEQHLGPGSTATAEAGRVLRLLQVQVIQAGHLLPEHPAQDKIE
jgi:hypothetical protein